MLNQGKALGGGVLAAALFEVLVENKILTKDQCTAVMDRAHAKLSILIGPETAEARKVLTSVGELVAQMD